MIGLSLLSQKGGVGKTTLALNLALSLARNGTRTLLVDVDPQGAVGLSLRGNTTRDALGLAGFDPRKGLESAVIKTRVPNLSLLTAGRVSGADLDAWYEELSTGQRLRDALRLADYDLCLVDTPAGLTGPAIAAARATENVLLPLQAEPLALRALPATLDRLATLRERGDAIRVVGMVLTMTGLRNEVSLSVLEEAWSLYPSLVFETHVPRDLAIAKASAEGVPVALLSKKPPSVASVFDRIAAEIEERLALTVGGDDGESIALVD